MPGNTLSCEHPPSRLFSHVSDDPLGVSNARIGKSNVWMFVGCCECGQVQAWNRHIQRLR